MQGGKEGPGYQHWVRVKMLVNTRASVHNADAGKVSEVDQGAVRRGRGIGTGSRCWWTQGHRLIKRRAAG